MDEVTFIIKTIERPQHLNALIKSIKEFYPNVKVIVADDGKDPVIREDVEYHVLPYDTGVSAGRNFLIDHVKTPYFVILDDDFVFTEHTRIEELLRKFKASDLDILGGAVNAGGILMDYYATLDRDGDTITYNRIVKSHGEYFTTDIIPFFFIARSDDEEIRFDPFFKTTEHFDFFYTMKLRKKKVGFVYNVQIDHAPGAFIQPDSYIEKRRKRGRIFLDRILTKYDIRELISFQETIK